mgnify:CR=1 FL=1
MAITVKKSAAPKTLRVSPRPGAASLSSQNPDFTAVPSELDLLRLKPKRSYTADIVLSIIGCLVFIGLLVVQYIEWDYYNQPPNAFPPFGTQEPLTLTQQWGAAPLGIQIAICICVAMIVVTIAGIISAIVKKSKANAELA